MNTERESQSPLVLSNTARRIYVCFCEKRFTTYPGVYLHLKSKHLCVFEKYKKLKITKLFKKVHEHADVEVYKLDKLPQAGSEPTGLPQKIIKQNKKNQKQEKKTTLECNSTENNGFKKERPVENKTEKPIVYGQVPRLAPIREDPWMNRQGFGQIRCSFGSFGGYPMSFPSPFASYMQYPPPMHQPKPTTKKLFQDFMFRANAYNGQSSMAMNELKRKCGVREPETRDLEKMLVRKALYNIMVEIDRNYELLNDSRVIGRMFLSYCDHFDPLLIQPLIQRHLTSLRQVFSQTTEPNKKLPLLSEMETVQKLQGWLIGTGLIDPSFKIHVPEDYLGKMPSQNQQQEKVPQIKELQKNAQDQRDDPFSA